MKANWKIAYVNYDTPHKKDCQAKVVLPKSVANSDQPALRTEQYLRHLVAKWGGHFNYMTMDSTTNHPKVPKTVRMDRNDSSREGKKPPHPGTIYKNRAGKKTQVNTRKPGVMQAHELKKGKVDETYTMGAPQFPEFKQRKHLHKVK